MSADHKPEPFQNLSAEQVASYCRVSTTTVSTWLREGRLRYTSAQGTKTVDADELVHFMHQNHLAIPPALLTPNRFKSHGDNLVALVVDEDRPMTVAISRVLRQLNLSVLEVHNGYDATTSFLQRKPALITLDLQLRDLNSLELIQNIKANNSQTVKILVITDAMPSVQARAKEAGADAVMAKPFDNDSLRRNVKILLDF